MWGKDKIETVEPTLKGVETVQVPGMDSAVVFGDPFAPGETLDFQQGFDNPYGAFGTCGLTSIANVCNIAGIDIAEPLTGTVRDSENGELKGFYMCDQQFITIGWWGYICFN